METTSLAETCRIVGTLSVVARLSASLQVMAPLPLLTSMPQLRNGPAVIDKRIRDDSQQHLARNTRILIMLEYVVIIASFIP